MAERSLLPLKTRIVDAWIDWRVMRAARRGAYDDPTTIRRRRLRAARYED